MAGHMRLVKMGNFVWFFFKKNLYSFLPIHLLKKQGNTFLNDLFNWNPKWSKPNFFNILPSYLEVSTLISLAPFHCFSLHFMACMVNGKKILTPHNSKICLKIDRPSLEILKCFPGRFHKSKTSYFRWVLTWFTMNTSIWYIYICFILMKIESFCFSKRNILCTCLFFPFFCLGQRK